MKQTYVTLILTRTEGIDVRMLKEIDLALSDIARMHEIIICDPRFSKELLFDTELKSPITIISFKGGTSETQIRVASLGRAVGDYIVEWSGDVKDIPFKVIDENIQSTESTFELVEYLAEDSSNNCRELKLVNKLRNTNYPINFPIGVLFSRNILNQVLAKSKIKSDLPLILAEFPPSIRLQKYLPVSFEDSKKKAYFLELVTNGTSFGSSIPFTIAGVSAVIGLGTIFYALITFAMLGKPPQGWTSLMILMGFGQASILTLLAFIWAKLSNMNIALGGSLDATMNCEIYSPKR